DPGDRAAALLDHRKDVAAGLANIVEVEHDEIGAGLHIGLGIDRELVSAPATPAAAMDEDQHRRVRAPGLVNVELLDLARPIGDALRLVEDFARDLVVVDAPLVDGPGVEGIDVLVIGVVDILLVHIEPDQRPLDARWRLGRAALRGGRRGGKYNSAGSGAREQSAAG